MEPTLTHAKPTEFTPNLIQPVWSLRLLATLLLWRQRARTRQQLAGLNDRQLADIGISAAEQRMEMEKPFWR